MDDRYLASTETMVRILREWREYGSKFIISYDFDHTVFDFDGIGDTHSKVMELLRLCANVGAYFIVYTCKPEEFYDEIREYCKMHDLSCDSINENAPFITYKLSCKLFYNVFLDDRAGLESVYKDLKLAASILATEKGLERKWKL